MKKFLRILAIVVVIAALVAGGIWFYQSRSSAQSVAATDGQMTQVVDVQQGDLSASISVVGALEAVQQETLQFDRLDGTTTLLGLDVAAGNTVEAGQALATIDSAGYQQALEQAESALQEAEEVLADLQAAATEIDIAQADLAVADAKLDLEQAQADLAELESSVDLTDEQAAVVNAQDSLDLARLQQTLEDHDSLAQGERDLLYSVDWHKRRIEELKVLVASGKANLEQQAELVEEQETLAEAEADLAQVQAQRKIAIEAAAAEVASAQAALADAQEALAEAQAGSDDLDLAQAQVAIEEATVALQTAEEARAELDEGADEVELASAQADVDKQRLAVAEAKADLEGATMAAPFAGTILSTNAEIGDRVASTSNILTLANLDQLHVAASVDETTIRQVAVGQAATITFDSYPDQTFAGVVLSVPMQGALQGDVMVYDVSISLEGAEELPLLVGMTANVDIQTGQVENALLVPTMALQTLNGMYQVLVPNTSDPTGDPVAVPVQVGLSNGTYAEIMSGLNAGDQVVVQLSTSDSNQNTFGGGGMGSMMMVGTGGPPAGGRPGN